ncbi:hypothetical protein BU16DRAFT_523463 [Lophium mytilinum]|uniref:Uncharacterized protein n=1 Tax=Lophium mytilinum TaxID=390894 RepID=A0A6A6R7B3_9PEZI|nr:hypothetical protein BU16DRAFT_523463 [Lophium mytilinum]
MARQRQQRAQKPPQTKAYKSRLPPIPEPFVPAPPELEDFLATLPKKSVYITHIDRHPAFFKRNIFTVPVLLNVGIAGLLLWRAWAIIPIYWGVILSMLGNPNEHTIFVKDSSWWKLATQIALRAASFLLDWVLVTVVAPWPYTFFYEGEETPVSWRWKVGFRDAEVYVRVSRGWGQADLLGAVKDGGSGKRGGESPFFKVRILPAIERNRVQGKTGYLLMDKDWDLEFAAMVDATKLLDLGELKEEFLEKSVFVWCGEEEGEGQWVVWNCYKLDEGSETEGRKRIVQFKDTLMALGKENLFFRWIELIQYESSQPGGFTPERQVQAAEKAKQMFQEQGVDWDEFIAASGGLDNLPGMELQK